ncbi:hypothetical protein N8I77_008882 [Diaporthe amygdali]|uniref:Uncharacterized protein n=1 Tax=Phomopsis amygdali TaxID=1214568 RepID=A0AAD9S8N3_PHOAM|nr:hypothetical protein N8I77_008882 [Diaporthe amygdali]
MMPAFPIVAAPHFGIENHVGPSKPRATLNRSTNLAGRGDSPELPAGDTSDKGGPAIPLADLRKAVHGIENAQAGEPSKLHNFVATDNGIFGNAAAGPPGAWQHNRSSALKIIDKSEAIEGLICPCITYGKIKHELNQAQKNRAGQEISEGDDFNACNGPCVSYAAVTTSLLFFQEFGGGILASKQTKDIALFYDLAGRERNKALTVVVHNATNLRNLVEVRVREEIEKRIRQAVLQRAQQYKSQLPMEMKKMLPDKLPQIEIPQGLEDALEHEKPRAISVVDRLKQKLAGKASKEPEKESGMELPTTLHPFQNFMAAESSTAIPGEQTAEPDVPFEPKKDEAGKLSSLTIGEKIKLKEDEQTKKLESKFGSRFKKSQKSKGKQVGRDAEPPVPAEAQPDPESDKATQGSEREQETITEVRLERGQSIVEIPANARVHSLSHDTFFIEKPPHLPHSIDLDTILPLDKARLSHVLEHDQIIQFMPDPQEHRLSADAMIPKTVAAPGHFLEGDPVVSGPKQVFSHELLHDPIVERAKAFLPHTLESDKKVAAKKIAKAHDLAGDTILPTPPKAAWHDLDKDSIVATGGPSRQEHDLSRDVRILSPSGQVRATHTIDADEVIKEGALFRKSPRPDAAAMPGNWASSSTSEEEGDNGGNGNGNKQQHLVASLNAVVNAADQALDELGQPASSGKENEAADAPAAHGLWGRMFPKRQAHAAATADATAPGAHPASSKGKGNLEGGPQT